MIAKVKLDDEADVLYHGSSKEGLTKLIPFECKHGKPYVYATRDYQALLHFSAKGQGMFDGWVEDDENGVATYYEARPNAFFERYFGKKSYCYILPADTFKSDVGDDYELVSEVAVDVIGVKVIEDVGMEFQKLIDEGKFKLVKYNTSEKNTKEICEDRALRLLIDRGYFEGKEFRQRKWASEFYKGIIEKYKKTVL